MDVETLKCGLFCPHYPYLRLRVEGGQGRAWSRGPVLLAGPTRPGFPIYSKRPVGCGGGTCPCPPEVFPPRPIHCNRSVVESGSWEQHFFKNAQNTHTRPSPSQGEPDLISTWKTGWWLYLKQPRLTLRLRGAASSSSRRVLAAVGRAGEGGGGNSEGGGGPIMIIIPTPTSSSLRS